MSTLLRFILLSPCLCLVLTGCGSTTPSTASTPAPTPTNVTGNWQFEINLPLQPVSGPIVLPTNPITGVFGSLNSSGKSVAAVLHATPLTIPHCVEEDTALPFTGTTDSSGNLSLTAPLAGGVATISANLLTSQTVTLPDGTVRNEPFFSGTYQVVGGSCAQPSITLNIFSVSNITGTFTGTLTAVSINNPPPPSSTITATFVQASAPDANGKYPLSGTITSTGGCNATYTFSSGAVSGDSAQNAYFLTSTFSIPPNPPIPVFQGAIAPATSRASILGTLNFDGCASFYQGVLNPSP
jgi:hypothetical protein